MYCRKNVTVVFLIVVFCWVVNFVVVVEEREVDFVLVCCVFKLCFLEVDLEWYNKNRSVVYSGLILDLLS